MDSPYHTVPESDSAPSKVSKLTFITVIVSTVAFTYPFYGVVSSLKDAEFIACNEPCHFFRLSGTEEVPSTFPYFAQVQNGVKRPLIILSTRSVGMFVSAKSPPPDDYLSGLWVDLMAPVLTTLNLTLDEVLVENDRKVKGNGSLQNISSSRAIAAVNKMLRSSGTFENFAYGFVRLPLYIYQLPFQAFSKKAGVENLPSATSSDKPSAESMHEWCDSDHAKASIHSDLSSSASVQCYLFSLVAWMMLKIVHDEMLLLDQREDITLNVGMCSLVFMCLAVAAGFQVAMGATEVFVSKLDSQEEPSACYYQISDVQVALTIVSPLLLLYHYFSKKKHIMQAVLAGDFLYFQREHMPYHVMRSNGNWWSFSMLQPRLRACRGGEVNTPRLSPRGLFVFYVLLLVLNTVEWLSMLLGVGISSSNMLVRLMISLCKLAVQPNMQSWFSFIAVRLLMLAPATMWAMAYGRNILQLFQRLKTIKMGLRILLAIEFTAIVVLSVSILFWLLLPPRRIIFGGSSANALSAEEVMVLVDLWAAGGFSAAVIVIRLGAKVFTGEGTLEDAIRCHTRLQQLTTTSPGVSNHSGLDRFMLLATHGWRALFNQFVFNSDKDDLLGLTSKSTADWAAKNPETANAFQLQSFASVAENLEENQSRQVGSYNEEEDPWALAVREHLHHSSESALVPLLEDPFPRFLSVKI